ncbi:MAG: M23 family metallopeptidase [Bacteroidota bacterium]|nr:M23 family metallopeptidase [Bacteroidota bacterium]
MNRKKQTIWQWLTTNFVVSIRNEQNFALKRGFTVNYAQILAIVVFGFILSAILNFYVFKVINDYYSGERSLENLYNKKLVQMSLRVDSLEYQISLKDSFITDIKDIVEGKDIAKLNSIANDSPPHKAPRKDDQPSEKELKLRDEFEKTQLLKNTSSVRINKSIADIGFFPPIDGGVVTANYDPKTGHVGIDVVAKANEPVKCTLDGTIVYAGWSREDGNTIIVQHNRELLSLYKHNSVLLRKAGNIVKAGEVIAIIGNSGELSSGPHLHFEIWYKGIALNPKDYIVF